MSYEMKQDYWKETEKVWKSATLFGVWKKTRNLSSSVELNLAMNRNKASTVSERWNEIRLLKRNTVSF